MATIITVGDGMDFLTIANALGFIPSNLLSQGVFIINVYGKAATANIYAEQVNLSTFSNPSENDRIEFHSMVPHLGKSQEAGGGGILITATTEAIVNLCGYTVFDGFEVRGGSRAGSYYGIYGHTAPYMEIKNCIVHDMIGTDHTFAIYLAAHSNYSKIRNCLAYNIDNSNAGGYAGCGVYLGATYCSIRNTTIRNITATVTANGFGIWNAGVGYEEVRNTCIFATSGENYIANFGGTWTANSDYNADDDGTGPGANSLHSLSDDDQFVSLVNGSEDFHLLLTSDLIGEAEDLSVYYTTDYENNTRYSWDIGAAESARPGPNSPYDVGAIKLYPTITGAINQLFIDTGGDLSMALGSDILVRVYEGGTNNYYDEQLDLTGFTNGKSRGNGDRIRIIAMTQQSGIPGSGITIRQNISQVTGVTLTQFASLEGFGLTQTYAPGASGWTGVDIKDKGYVLGCMFYGVSAVTGNVNAVTSTGVSGFYGEVSNCIIRDCGWDNATIFAGIDLTNAIDTQNCRVMHNTIINNRGLTTSAGIKGSIAFVNPEVKNNYVEKVVPYNESQTTYSIEACGNLDAEQNATSDSAGEVPNIAAIDVFESYTPAIATDILYPKFGSAIDAAGVNVWGDVNTDFFGSTRTTFDIGAIESAWGLSLSPSGSDIEIPITSYEITTDPSVYYVSKSNFIVTSGGLNYKISQSDLARVRPGIRYQFQISRNGGGSTTPEEKMVLGNSVPIYLRSKGVR